MNQHGRAILLFDNAISANVIRVSMGTNQKFQFQLIFFDLIEDFPCFTLIIKARINDDGFTCLLAT